LRPLSVSITNVHSLFIYYNRYTSQREKRLVFFPPLFDHVNVLRLLLSASYINHPINGIYNQCIGDNNIILDRFDDFWVYPAYGQPKTHQQRLKGCLFYARHFKFNEYNITSIYHIYLMIYIYIIFTSLYRRSVDPEIGAARVEVGYCALVVLYPMPL